MSSNELVNYLVFGFSALKLSVNLQLYFFGNFDAPETSCENNI